MANYIVIHVEKNGEREVIASFVNGEDPSQAICFLQGLKKGIEEYTDKRINFPCSMTIDGFWFWNESYKHERTEYWAVVDDELEMIYCNEPFKARDL